MTETAKPPKKPAAKKAAPAKKTAPAKKLPAAKLPVTRAKPKQLPGPFMKPAAEIPQPGKALVAPGPIAESPAVDIPPWEDAPAVAAPATAPVVPQPLKTVSPGLDPNQPRPGYVSIEQLFQKKR